MWPLRPNQICPACPSDLVFCPLPLTHPVSNTLTFVQFLRYTELTPTSGPLHLLFPLPGRLSSSSSIHGIEVLAHMSLPLGTIHSLTQLCPHTLPRHNFYCIALFYLHHSLYCYLTFAALLLEHQCQETKTRCLLSLAISSAPRAVSACAT